MANVNQKKSGGIKGWIYTLMGKTPPSVNIPQEGSHGDQSVGNELQEDSVANDIKMFKEFARKSIEKTKLMVAPYAKKGVSSATDARKSVSASVDNKFLKTLIKGFMIVFFIIVLIFIVFYLFRSLKEENGNKVSTETVSVTPAPFLPYKPSVYDQDPEILQLEEEVGILERELTRVNIKEDGINPPKLDYNISF